MSTNSAFIDWCGGIGGCRRGTVYCEYHSKKFLNVPLTDPAPTTNLQEMILADKGSELQEVVTMEGQEADFDTAVKNAKAGQLICAAENGGFVTKDSGTREEFTSGMVRDTSSGKIRYDLVYMPMLKRWAELMTRGAIKYSANNWMKASGQPELDRFKESAFRHFMTWFLDEDTTEDHAAAVFFNISGAEYVKEKLER